MTRKVTLSVIKADVGSIGGHTMPSKGMMKVVQSKLSEVRGSELIDFLVTHTGDDIAITMSHTLGVGSHAIHKLAWDCFMQATEQAEDEGQYGAGQDLLVDAPSGNVRGAGPAVAEIEFDLLPDYRPAEAFLIFAADKCGPGAYNFHLWNTFCNPQMNTGLLLSPALAEGFIFTIIDMDHKSEDKDRIITIDTTEPNAHQNIATLLRNIDRFAVEAVHSNAFPGEQIVSLSATRLHNIAGAYTGKDDPVMIFRTQKTFPAPEEVVEPYKICPYVTGDCRGSHTMTLMPVAVNTPVRGEYCQPVVSCCAFSMDRIGRFAFRKGGSGFDAPKALEHVDMFGGPEWDPARAHAIQKSNFMREQGVFGVAMASQEELAYTGIVERMNELDERFELRDSVS